MVEFRWFITEDMNSYTDDEVINEDLYIDAYFDMNLNGRIWGFYPDSDVLLYEFHGDEDLSYLFSQFEEYVLALKDGEDVFVMVLQYNLVDLYFKRVGDRLLISQHRIETNQMEWTEEVGFDEFAQVVHQNVKEFLAAVEKKDNRFLANEGIKKLQNYVKE